MKTADEWSKDLIDEHERAIKQRDTFILTGVSTAGHGGSHDTCFGYIVKQIQLDAWKQGMSDAISKITFHPMFEYDYGKYKSCECVICVAKRNDKYEIENARDSKATL